eukprot:48332-Eustigmatos_ZCMA.PRE.1
MNVLQVLSLPVRPTEIYPCVGHAPSEPQRPCDGLWLLQALTKCPVGVWIGRQEDMHLGGLLHAAE